MCSAQTPMSSVVRSFSDGDARKMTRPVVEFGPSRANGSEMARCTDGEMARPDRKQHVIHCGRSEQEFPIMFGRG